MMSHIEVTLVLSGPTDVVYGESQKIYDAALEIEPSVMKSISYEYFNMEEKV